MAHKRNHQIVETWRSRSYKDVVYYVTKNDRILRQHKGREASVKILHFFDDMARFNFNGVGRRATATEFRYMLEVIAVKEE